MEVNSTWLLLGNFFCLPLFRARTTLLYLWFTVVEEFMVADGVSVAWLDYIIFNQ